MDLGHFIALLSTDYSKLDKMKTTDQIENFKFTNLKITNNVLLCLFIIIIVSSKIILSGKGFFGDGSDEMRYEGTFKALNAFYNYEIKEGISYIFSTQGRPLDAVIKIIPASLQIIYAKIHGNYIFEPINSYPLFFFNFIIYLLILFQIYSLTKKLLEFPLAPYLSVLVYSSLTNSHLYIRHALPYDTSLLIYLYLFNKVFTLLDEKEISIKTLVTTGFLSFIGYLVYPGYSTSLLILVSIFFFYKLDTTNYSNKIKQTVYMGIGILVCLVVTEVISRYAGTTYIGQVIHLSNTIKQGSFNESFSFIFKYLFEVEQLTGILLIASIFITFGILLLKRLRIVQLLNSKLYLFIIISLFIFLLYAGAGYFFHKVVLYGRLLHQYIPLICIIFAFTFFSLIPKSKVNLFLLVIIITITIDSFFKLSLLNKYSYPRDMVWEAKNIKKPINIKLISEYDNYWPSFTKSEQLEFSLLAGVVGDTMYITNAFIFHPMNDLKKYHPFKKTSNMKFLKSAPHFLTYIGYQYEGYNIEERKNLAQLKFNIELNHYNANLNH